MNKKGIILSTNRWVAATGLIWLATFMVASAVMRNGEAVVVARVGKVQARVFAGSVHYGKTEVMSLEEGSSVGETSRVMTGKDGRACLILSPGAILCVAPNTELTFKQLRQSADGLPKTEEDLIRRIHIDLKRGRVLVHAAAPLPTLDIRIQTKEGLVASSGGTFVVAQADKQEWALISEEYNQFVTPENGERTEILPGEALKMARSGESVSVEKEDSFLQLPLRKFEICNCFFDDLENFIQDPARMDRAGLADYIGRVDGFDFVGPIDSVTDVSPSIRRVIPGEWRKVPPASSPARGGRWDAERAWNWYEQVGVLKGVNYIPRNAVNSTDMWLEETFDKDLIDEELGWARKAGYTALRVQLQYVVWTLDSDAFLDRVDTLLDLAEKHDLRVVPVLFDDKNLAGQDPASGQQPDPVPGKHNARWTPSPGVSVAMDRAAWPSLEEYVKDVIGEFKKDDRVVYWDLYNRTGDFDLWEKTLPLMDQAFLWARDVNPNQPLAVAAWSRMGSAMSARMLERSDIITFQSFQDKKQVEALLMLLRRYDRPIICSDWLFRQQGSAFDKMLPLFSVHRVGWFNRGLVRGKTQQWIQQEAFRSETDPELWQHDVLEEDGDAYDEKELELIQAFRFDN